MLLLVLTEKGKGSEGGDSFFAVFVKASPQDEHGVERPALSQGCGGGVAPRHPIIPSIALILFIALKSLPSLKKSVRRFVTFSKISSIFRLLKTFLSY